MDGRMNERASAREPESFDWPAEGATRVPDWVYTSPTIYQREIERIFHGPFWNFVGLEVEIPNPGDYRRAYVGETPVITIRGKDQKIHVVQNRCAHRGTEFCRSRKGNAETLVCPYHQWTYSLEGDLISVPFRRGLNKLGGMPPDFKLEDHGLRKLKVATRNGLIFASFAENVPPIDEFLGTGVCNEFDTFFGNRQIKVLGYFRQRWNSNWKLYQENLRDPNHASLLHVFLSTFGFHRPDNVVQQYVSDHGWHSIGYSRRGEQKMTDQLKEISGSTFQANLRMKDERFLSYTKEDKGPWTAAISSIWPNFAVQRQVNSLAIREVVPNGPSEFFLYWTFFGFEGDSEEMTKHRMRQGALTGPAGMVGVDDSEVLDFVTEGFRKSVPDAAVLSYGGEDRGTVDTLISEAAIRSLYDEYRKVMGL